MCRLALRGVLLAAALALSAATARAADTPSAEVDEPRAYGYHVGDMVRRVVRLRVPAPWRLDPASLPAQGRRGRAVELRVLHWSAPGLLDDEHRLVLEYQVFLSPPAAQVLELPPLRLEFLGGERPLALRVDAWPLALAPLVGVEAPQRRGLGELRPLAMPPAPDTAGPRARLMLWTALALPCLAWLAQVYLLAPWWRARHRPFARAWAALHRLPDEPDRATRRAAYRALHEALNRSAGEVVYASGLDAFLARQPRFRPLAPALREFHARSNAEFFAVDEAAANPPAAGEAGANPHPGAHPPARDAAPRADGAWLRDLARRCRDLERGAA